MSSDEFSGYIHREYIHVQLYMFVFSTVKSKNLFLETLLRRRFLFSRIYYVCPIWIFIINTDQAQIYSERKKLRKSYVNLAVLVIVFSAVLALQGLVGAKKVMSYIHTVYAMMPIRISYSGLCSHTTNRKPVLEFDQ